MEKDDAEILVKMFLMIATVFALGIWVWGIRVLYIILAFFGFILITFIYAGIHTGLVWLLLKWFGKK